MPKLKLLAGLLGVSFDSLKQRDAHHRIRHLQLVMFALLMITLSLAGLAAYAIHQRDKAVKARQQAESVLEFLVYDMSDELRKVGRLDIVDKVQRRVGAYHQELGFDKSLPKTFHNQVTALNNAGDLAVDKGDLVGALQAYRQSLTVAQQLAATRPSDNSLQHDLFVSYWKMADTAEQNAAGEAPDL